MEKIKGITKIYDSKTTKEIEIEIEAELNIEWEIRKILHPWAIAKCPYDGELIVFDIAFSDDVDFPHKTVRTGDCVHFSQGLLRVKETANEFAEKMGWKLQWRESLSRYFVFVEKTGR